MKRTLTPVWDHQFNFEFEKLTKSQLETMKISFEVIDKGVVDLFNSHLGGYEVDLTTVYFSLNHMFSKTWFTLFDFEEIYEGCMGFVKATIEILGPNDEPTINEAITDDPSIEKTVISSKIKPKGHMIVSEVYRAEYIAPVNIGSRHVNPYVKVKYGGIEKATKKLENTSNPDFNQIMFIPVMLPNHSKNVYVELYDYGILNDSLVGSAIIPFNCFKDSDNFKPLWVNIYGPPTSAIGKTARVVAINGHKSGSTFRGRILMRFSSNDEASPVGSVQRMEFRLPEIAVPNTPSKTYLLRIDLFEGNELPTKNKAIFHFCIGPYLLKSTLKTVGEKNRSQIIWNEEIEERRLQLPMDVNQIPDFFIYFCDEDAESHRVSYARIKASEFLSFGQMKKDSMNKAKIIKFREDKTLELLSDDAFPGFAVIKIDLLGKTSLPRVPIAQLMTKSTRLNKAGTLSRPGDETLSTYNFYINLYVGRDLLPGSEDGTSNPRIVFKVLGQKTHSTTQYQTLNPNFNEVVKFKLPNFQKNVLVPPTLIILVYHIIKDGNKEKVGSLLGRYWMMLKIDHEKLWLNKLEKDEQGNCVTRKIYFEQPKWVPLIYDRDEKIRGRLLMGYALSESEIDEKYFNMKPQTELQYFTIYPFGFRDILFNYQKKIHKVTFSLGINNSQIEFDLLDKEMAAIFQNQDSAKKSTGHKNLRIEDLSAYFNEKIRFGCQIPNKKELCPIMEVFLYIVDDKGNNNLLGIAQYELSKVLKYYYSESEDKEYKEQWEMNFYLDKLNLKEENKQKFSRAKAQKFKQENLLIYNENFVYDVKFPNDSKESKIYHVPVTGIEIIEQGLENEPQTIIGKDRKGEKPESEKEADLAIQESKDYIELEKNKKEFWETEKNALNSGKIRIEDNPEAQVLTQEESRPPILVSDQNVFFAKQIDDRFVSSKSVVKSNKNRKIGIQMDEIMLLKKTVIGENELPQISRIELDFDKDIEHLSNDFSKEKLEFDDVFVKENEDALKKTRKQETKGFLAGLKFSNPFKGIFTRKNKTKEYLDYDTDDDEEFEDVLPYLKGRKEFQTALEKSLLKDPISKTMTTIGIYRADKNIGNSLLKRPRKVRRKVASFKFLFIRENRTDLVPIKRIDKFLKSIVAAKEYNVRVYILRGLQITSRYEEKPKTYLKMVMNGVSYVDEDSVREGSFPEYYRSKQFDKVKIPGTALLRIEIWEKKVGFDSLLGYTDLDLEERVFSTVWQELGKKPVEKRSIENDAYGSRGKLEVWIDIVNWKSKEPMAVIFPKLQLDYELRVIVWETKDCVFKNTIGNSNDLYARGNVMRGDMFLETDTHWLCRNKGSFNWRWKFPIKLPVDENKNYGEDRFIMQIWDRNLINRDEMIGETEVSLNTHNMLKKSHFRRKAVQMRMREKGSGSETNMFWFDVFHPNVLDKNGNKVCQGRVHASFQVLPIEEGEKFDNGIGRAAPNFFPTLPDPVGRFTFNFLNPCGMVANIIGKDLCCRIICCACLILFLIICVFVGYFILTTFVGTKIALAV